MMADPRRLVWGACVAMALVARPALASLSIVGPPPARVPPVGFEFGSWISASAPTGAAGDVFTRGINTGVTVSTVRTSVIAAGIDLAYSRWPSPAAGASLDALFTALGSAPVRGTRVTLTSLQVGGHVKASLLPGRRVAPWFQAGVSVSRANRKIEFPVDQMRAAGWQVVEATSDEITYQPLIETSIGFDLRTGAGMKIGLDASYQWMMLSGESDPFTAFRIGGHVLFGRW